MDHKELALDVALRLQTHSPIMGPPTSDVLLANAKTIYEWLEGGAPAVATAGLTFGQAIDALKQGKTIKRAGIDSRCWLENGQLVTDFPETGRRGTPFFAQVDIFATDWEIVEQPRVRMTWVWAQLAMSEGFVVARAGWVKAGLYRRNDGEICWIGNRHPYTPIQNEQNAVDWETRGRREDLGLW